MNPFGTAHWCAREIDALVPAQAGAGNFHAAAAALLLIVAIGSPIALIRIRGDASWRRRPNGERSSNSTPPCSNRPAPPSDSGELGQRVRALDAVRRAAAISNSAALRGRGRLRAGAAGPAL